MVHEIHLGVIVAVVTILIPTAVLVSSAGSFSPIGDSAKMASAVQSAEAAKPQTPAKISTNQNAMETLKQLYNDQAFVEIARCLGSEGGDKSMCAETMEMLITTCDDYAVERIAACDDSRLQEYRSRV